MSIITLTSDYGLTDYRVAAIKGSILNRNENLQIVDISHTIQAYDLQQTAYIVKNAYHFFPKETVHIISVDSFYAKERKAVLYKADGHHFIAADNGLLSLVFFDQKPEAVYEITLNNRFDDVVSSTTTDIFVPAAVHLKNGGLPEVIGRILKNPKQISFARAVMNESEKMIVGEVLYIDNFGNVVSNISKKFFTKSKANYENYKIRFRNIVLSKIHESYSDIVTDWKREQEFHGKPAVIFNAGELLELSIYKGNIHNGAKALFGMNVGEKIYIEFE